MGFLWTNIGGGGGMSHRKKVLLVPKIYNYRLHVWVARVHQAVWNANQTTTQILPQHQSKQHLNAVPPFTDTCVYIWYLIVSIFYEFNTADNNWPLSILELFFSLLRRAVHGLSSQGHQCSGLCNELEVTWIGMLIFATSARNVPYSLLFQKNLVGIFYFQGKGHFVTFKGHIIQGQLWRNLL